eukprot:UN18127
MSYTNENILNSSRNDSKPKRTKHSPIASCTSLTPFHFIKRKDLKFLEQIGKGSFGIVKKAEYFGTFVAVKLLQTNVSSGSKENIEEFKREAESWKNIPPQP